MVAVAYDVAVVCSPAQTDIDAVGGYVQLAGVFTDGVAADENRCRQRPVSRTGFFGGGERIGGSGPAQRSVRSVVVVEITELGQQYVEFVEGGRSWVGT